MIRTAPRARHTVVDIEQLEREVALAAVAEALLLSEQDVFVLPVIDRGIYIRTAGDVGPGGNV